MRKISNGNYAVYKSQIFDFYKLHNNTYRLIDRENNFENLNQLGFIKYTDVISTLDVQKEEIQNAYYVDTYCVYRGYKHFVNAILNNNRYRILPLEEAQIHFKDFARHGYDPVYEVDEIEIEEIWEERTPVEGFKFDVEPIFYLKKKE